MRQSPAEIETLGREKPPRNGSTDDGFDESPTRNAIEVEKQQVLAARRENRKVQCTRLPKTVVGLPYVLKFQLRLPTLYDSPDLLPGTVVGDDDLEPGIAPLLRERTQGRAQRLQCSYVARTTDNVGSLPELPEFITLMDGLEQSRRARP